MMPNIGYMQGRLVDMVDGKIQCFPWQHWQDEFPLAHGAGFRIFEWTLDQDRLYENPLMSADGQGLIKRLQQQYGLHIPSLTGDCFMQAPFWKAEGAALGKLLDDCAAIADACAELGIKIIVVPLVDNGSIQTPAEADRLQQGLERIFASRPETLIAFESDFAPSPLAEFMTRFPARQFGVNYDIGNSAALGFNCHEEIAAYGTRIINVHVKDRVLGGTTVALGTGNADLKSAILNLGQAGYDGNYILQTARAADGSHVETAVRYARMTRQWIIEASDGA